MEKSKKLDIEQKILTLMKGLGLDQFSIMLPDIEGQVTLKLENDTFTFIGVFYPFDGGEVYNFLKLEKGLIMGSSHNGEIRFSITRFYFALLRECNSRIENITKLMNKAL